MSQNIFQRYFLILNPKEEWFIKNLTHLNYHVEFYVVFGTKGRGGKWLFFRCLVYVWIHVCILNQWTHVCVLRFCSFFFFSHVLEKRDYCSCTVYWTVTANVDFSAVNSASVYYSWTHKFHFSATFSLKIGPIALLTHLKIILLECFQFSVLTK